MATNSSTESYMRPLILAAEREAQMVSAFARLAVIAIAMTIFMLAGGVHLPVAPVVLTYLISYALVSILSAIFSLKRFFNPWMSLLFTAIDGISLALLIGFALRVTDSPMSLHGAVPGFVFIFSILILSTMRYTIGPTLVVFTSFAATWILFSNTVGDRALPIGSNPDFLFWHGTERGEMGIFGRCNHSVPLGCHQTPKDARRCYSCCEQRVRNLSRYLPDRIADLVAEQGIDALSSGQ